MQKTMKTLPDAKRALQETFLDLYAQKPYEQISIKELCEKAHVARTTFYFHYQNLAELKQELEDGLIDGLLNVADAVAEGDYTTIDFHQFASRTLSFIDEHRKPFMAFLVTQPSNTFRERWTREMKSHLELVFPEMADRKNWEMLLEIFSNMLLTAYAFWLQNPEKMDLDIAEQDFMKTLNVLVNQ